MLKALADEHVVYGVIEALRVRGMNVLTVQDMGRQGDDDEELLRVALSEGRLLLTNDEDFLRLAAMYGRRKEPFPPVLFWPQQQRSVGEIVRRVFREASLREYGEICSRVLFL